MKLTLPDAIVDQIDGEIMMKDVMALQYAQDGPLDEDI